MRAGALAVLLAVLVLLALPAAPSAAARPVADATLTFASPQTLTFDAAAVTMGREAAYQRGYMDADDDGDVTEAEAAAYGAEAHGIASDAGLGVPLGRILLDGHEPETVDVVSVRVEGAAGPNASEAPFTVHWQVRLSFAAGEAERTLEVQPMNMSFAGFVDMQIASLSVLAPPGHAFTGTGGLPLGAIVSGDGRAVVLPTGLPENDMQFRVAAVPEARPAPGPGLLSALVGLALLVRQSRAYSIQ